MLTFEARELEVVPRFDCVNIDFEPLFHVPSNQEAQQKKLIIFFRVSNGCYQTFGDMGVIGLLKGSVFPFTISLN